VYQVHKELKVLKDKQEVKVCKGLKVQRESLDLKALKEHKVLQDHHQDLRVMVRFLWVHLVIVIF
jgi:hypothetical protein